MMDEYNVTLRHEPPPATPRVIVFGQRHVTMGELVQGSLRWTRNGKHPLALVKPVETQA